jgi:ferredoxin
MQVRVDVGRCVAVGQCALIAPAVFDQREEDGVVELLQAAPELHEFGAVRESAKACPAAAIHVDE